MRLRIKRHTNHFKSLTLDLDSQEELDLIGSLFNCTPVTDALEARYQEMVPGGDMDLRLYEALTEAGANTGRTLELALALANTIWMREHFASQQRGGA